MKLFFKVTGLSAALIFSMLLSAAFPLIAFADETKPKSAIPDEFNVGDYLRYRDPAKSADDVTDEGTQGQFYFEEAKRLTEETGQQVSPVAAFALDVIDFLTKVIASVALLIFIAGGLLTIVSEGQEDRIQKGKQAMLYALIGLAIALFSYFIVVFVQSIFF